MVCPSQGALHSVKGGAVGGFVLGWEETIGNVTVIGRPFSQVSATKGYNKLLVKARINDAVTIARRMATETRNLVSKSMTAAIEMRMGPGPHGLVTTLSPTVEAAVAAHFKLPAPMTQANADDWTDLFKYLNTVYMMISQGINGPLKIVDIPSADKLDTNGSVSLSDAKALDTADPSGLRVAKRGRIHINFHWVTTRTAQRVARTVIHEASHKFVGARDHAYKPNKPNYAALTPKLARTNADSIACFAYYTWKNGAYALD